MENTGLKGLGVTLYQRVFLSYKTTLIGIAVACVPYVIDAFSTSPTPWLHTVGLVLGGIFAFVKEKLPTPPTAPSLGK